MLGIHIIIPLTLIDQTIMLGIHIKILLALIDTTILLGFRIKIPFTLIGQTTMLGIHIKIPFTPVRNIMITIELNTYPDVSPPSPPSFSERNFPVF